MNIFTNIAQVSFIFNGRIWKIIFTDSASSIATYVVDKKGIHHLTFNSLIDAIEHGIAIGLIPPSTNSTNLSDSLLKNVKIST